MPLFLLLLVTYRPLAPRDFGSKPASNPLDTSYSMITNKTRSPHDGCGERTRVRFCTARRRTFGTPSSSRYAFTVLGSAPQALAMAFTSTFLRSKIGS